MLNKWIAAGFFLGLVSACGQSTLDVGTTQVALSAGQAKQIEVASELPANTVASIAHGGSINVATIEQTTTPNTFMVIGYAPGKQIVQLTAPHFYPATIEVTVTSR